MRALRKSGVALVALLACGAFAPAYAVSAQSALTKNADSVDAQMSQLSERWRATQFKGVKALGGKSAKALEFIGDKHKFIVRRPRRGNEHGLRVNIATQRMAAAMGEQRMVPAAIVENTRFQLDPQAPIGTQLMIMHHAGGHYVGADVAQPQLIRQVPERSRLVAALIDLLSEQQDRKSANILVKDDGTAVKLIDPDKAFGQRHGAKYRSQFFHGGKVGYTSRQEAFTDLPPDLQAYVSELASSTPAKVQHALGLQPEEAQVVINQAVRVTQVGLRHAIDEYVTSLGELHPPE